MTKKTELPQSRHHVLIFDEDWAFLNENYGAQALKPIGVSAAIRKIIHAKVLGLRQRFIEQLDARQQPLPGQEDPADATEH